MITGRRSRGSRTARRRPASSRGSHLSPFAPDDIEVQIQVFVSGVTFEDGTTVKTLTKSDFNALGHYQLVLLKDEERLGSICHRIKVYQNGEFVGQRR